ncbi:aquaporin-11-like [Ylistrum balloti]|uniref:aquaporin-11-like n=1 Tax=Ylistrum balloti TaxID=509963 RepID=UPI0029059D37|nr:aquaporin-11-like [Ylistrum balloti]
MAVMTWRDMWTVVMGDTPDFLHFHPILATVSIYLLIMVFCYLMYQLSSLLPSPLRSYAFDFFTTMAFCAYPFGHIVIRQAYGGVGYMSAIVPLVIISVNVFSKGTGSPLGYWMGFLQGTTSLWTMITHIPVQILAGMASFILGRYIYMLDFHESFASALTDERCYSDMKTTLAAGFSVEMLGVTFDGWLKQQTLIKVKFIDLLLKVINCSILVNLGVNFTGMYMHPAMASGLTFGCDGTERWEHLFVYWVGPFTGCFLALQLNKIVKIPDLSNLQSQTSKKFDVDRSGINKNGWSKQNGTNGRMSKTSTESSRKQVRRRKKRWY